MIKLIHDDCIKAMQQLGEGSIDLTVTSPPYDNLRTYEGSLEWNEDIWKQVLDGLYRVTKDGGVVVWVVGDATIKGSETGTSFKQALYAKEIGFNLHDTMIYNRCAPPLTHKRYEQEFEYMFVFSKGKLSSFNGIQRERKYQDTRKSKKFRRKADGGYDIGSSKQSKMVLSGNVWKVFAAGGAGDNFSSLHPAPFPEQLAHDHVISWSNEGDTVFDPFLGSGTTGKMAKQLNRNFIGIEKVEEYYNIAKARIHSHN
jgi:site-specific DNA-methyltransferase (adenine-specific)